MYRYRTLVYAVIAAIGITAPMAFGAASTRAAGFDRPAPAPHVQTGLTSTTLDATRLLNSTGRFVGEPGVDGTIDTSRWQLVSNLRTGEAPRLAPAGKAVQIHPASLPDWSALGGSGDGAVRAFVFAMAVMGTDLYIGGRFTDVAGISSADYIARWDGTAWHNLDAKAGGAGSLNDAVAHLVVWKNSLYVAGDFTNADGIASADYIARWDGAWHSLGDNGANNGALDSVVTGLGTSSSYLYVGGFFANVGGDPGATHFARWNGTAWSKLGNANHAVFNSGVTAIVVVGSTIYAGGQFTNAAGIKEADYIARWSGGAWHALGSGPGAGGGALNAVVEALAWLNGRLYVGGEFTNAGGNKTADYLASWNGSKWLGLGSYNGNGAVDDPVLSLATYGTDLYVGGGFDITGVPNTGGVARWNGSKWFAIGNTPALHAQANAVAIMGKTLFVGGDFEDANGIPEADYAAAYGPISFHQPDGTVGIGGSIAGSDIYNANGAGQKRTGLAPVGQAIHFALSIGNDGNVTETFKVHATGAANANYIVRYFDGATEITNAVANGTYVTPTLAPGATHDLLATVKVKISATAGSGVTRLVTFSAAKEPSKVDAVTFVGKLQ